MKENRLKKRGQTLKIEEKNPTYQSTGVSRKENQSERRKKMVIIKKTVQWGKKIEFKERILYPRISIQIRIISTKTYSSKITGLVKPLGIWAKVTSNLQGNKNQTQQTSQQTLMLEESRISI